MWPNDTLSRMLNYGHEKAILFVNQNETSISYLDLHQKILALASSLVQHTKSQQPVLLFSDKSILTYAGSMAAMVSGNVFIPLHKSQPGRLQEEILNKVQPQLAFVDRASAPYFNKITQRGHCPKVVITDSQCQQFDPKIKVLHMEDLTVDKTFEPFAPKSEDKCYLMSTSGTTGEPRLVVISYGNLQSLLDNILVRFQIQTGDRISQTYDAIFDPYLADIFIAFSNGGTLVPFTHKDHFDAVTWIQKNKIVMWSSVPSILQMNPRSLEGESKYSSLRYSIFTGEKLTNNLVTRWQTLFPKSLVENYYGPTETTIWISSFKLSAKKSSTPLVPIGQIFSGHDWAIVDDSLEKVSDVGEMGALIISGPQVFSGYWNDNDATQKVKQSMRWDMSEKQWYLTGDIVCINSDYDLEIFGRSDGQFKVGGVRLSTESIEGALEQELGQACVVFPYPLSGNNFLGIIAVIMQELEDGEVKEHVKNLRSLIPSVAIPRKFILTDSFPCLPNGKIDRRQLLKNIESLYISPIIESKKD